VTDERLSTSDLVADERDGDREQGPDGAAQAGPRDDALEPLFAEERSTELRERWRALQARFVDEPRETVSEADSLVAELLQELARGFSDARSSLEAQWSAGDDVSTEDLRLSLQRYRSFFERLLTV
jgi:hypothetical protein